MDKSERKENGMIEVVQMEVDCKKMEEAAEKLQKLAGLAPEMIRTAAEIFEMNGMPIELSEPIEEVLKDMREVMVIGHVACRMIAGAMRGGREGDE